MAIPSTHEYQVERVLRLLGRLAAAASHPLPGHAGQPCQPCLVFDHAQGTEVGHGSLAGALPLARAGGKRSCDCIARGAGIHRGTCGQAGMPCVGSLFCGADQFTSTGTCLAGLVCDSSAAPDQPVCLLSCTTSSDCPRTDVFGCQAGLCRPWGLNISGGDAGP